MITTYFVNPLAEMEPSLEKYSNPPLVQYGSLRYLILLYWDMAILQTKMSEDAYAAFYNAGVQAQALLVDADGDEYYARIFASDKSPSGWITTIESAGFKGAKPALSLFDPTQQEEINMHPLDKLKEFIVSRYDEPAASEVRSGLESASDFKGVWAYINWDEPDWQALLEEFFNQP